MSYQTDMEYGHIPMEKNTKDNGQMEKKMVQGFILIVMVENSLGFLLMGWALPDIWEEYGE